MPENRFYLKKTLTQNEPLRIDDKEFHHLKVLRVKKNDIIELINGRGYLAKAQVQDISNKHADLLIQSIHYEEPKKNKFILAQSITKMNRLDYILEKATELGVDEFCFFYSKHSDKIKLSENRLNRITSIIISSMKQCGRLYLPKITILKKLEYFQDLKGSFYFGDVRKTANYLKKLDNREDLYCFIGPETGFSDDEINYLENDLQAKGIKLHNNILRVDTASIIATYSFVKN